MDYKIMVFIPNAPKEEETLIREVENFVFICQSV